MLRSRRLTTAAFILLAAACLSRVTAQGAAAQPFVIGVSGDYPNGIDGQLSARGIPWQRVFAWEMSDPHVLAHFDVLMLSCLPVAHQPAVDDVLLAWLEAGGRAYVETWAAQTRYPLQKLTKVGGNGPSKGDVILTCPDDPLAVGLDCSLPVDMHHLQGVRVSPRPGADGEVLATYTKDGGAEPNDRWPAIVRVRVGEGELIYSGAPLAFARFHRGNSAEPLLDAIIRTLVQGRASTRLLYTEPDNDAPPTGGARVAEHDAPADPAPTDPVVEPPAPAQPAAPPEGIVLIDVVPDDRYTFAADIGSPVERPEPTVLVLEAEFDDTGKPRRPCLWLSLTPDRIALYRGKRPGGKTLASSEWQPVEGAQLLVRRRPGVISVSVNEAPVLTAPVTTSGGAIALEPGSIELVDPYAQPVAPVRFADDFMRGEMDETPWTPVSGEWRNVGVGNEAYSINGFYYHAKAESPAVAHAGHWFWDEYTIATSVRPNAEGSSIGVAGLLQRNGDGVAFIAGPDSTRFVRTLAGEEAVLAERDGGCAPGQWVRLAMRLTHDGIEGLLDGEVVLTCVNPEPRGGMVGLVAFDGSARFDDVIVQPASEPIASPRDEGRPVAAIPDSMGPHDYMTWANPATPWIPAPERPSILWHANELAGDFTASVALRPVSSHSTRGLILSPLDSGAEPIALTAALEPQSEHVELTIAVPNRKPAIKRLPLSDVEPLTIRREADVATLVYAGKAIAKLGKCAGVQRIGARIAGEPLPAIDLLVSAPSTRDYAFGVAPTEWWASSGEWEVSARWACDNRWSWLAGWGAENAAIWNKHRVDGDVALDAWIGVKMEAPGGPETKRCRDLNAVLCGDRADPRSGYSFIIGGDGGVKTQILRNGELVAESAQVRVPSGYNVHHRWFHLRVSRIGSRIALQFEGRTVLEYDDPDPLPGGFVGLWTHNSGVLIPRATIWSASAP